MATVLQEDERLCPFCAEVIKKAAVVCKHCHRGLTSPTTMEVVTPEEARGITEQGLALKTAVDKYMTAGWTVTGSTINSVQMRKRQPFNAMVVGVSIVIAIFTAGIGLFIGLVYWYWWLMNPANIVLTIGSDGTVLRNGIPDPGPQVMPAQTQTNIFGSASNPSTSTRPQSVQPTPSPLTPEQIAKNRQNTKRILIVIGVIIGGYILLCLIVQIFGAIVNATHGNAPAVFLPIVSML